MEQGSDPLAEAVARLKQEALSNPLPGEIADETTRQLAEAQTRMGPRDDADRESRRHIFTKTTVRTALAAAALIVLGYAGGRLTAPMDMDQIREAITPAVAASIEPAIREKLIEDLRHGYQLALAGTYVKVREELTKQYRDDMNRFAAQTLAASNAVTNQLLTELLHTIKAEQSEDLRRIASVLQQVELKRLQDKEQLATGLETLAYRTEGELQRTRTGLVQLLVNTYPLAEVPMGPDAASDPNERS